MANDQGSRASNAIYDDIMRTSRAKERRVQVMKDKRLLRIARRAKALGLVPDDAPADAVVAVDDELELISDPVEL